MFAIPIATACILSGRLPRTLHYQSLPRVSFQGVAAHLAFPIAAACILAGRVTAHLAFPTTACIAAAVSFRACRCAPCITNRCRVILSWRVAAHLALPIAAACILSGRVAALALPIDAACMHLALPIAAACILSGPFRRAPCITHRCRQASVPGDFPGWNAGKNGIPFPELPKNLAAFRSPEPGFETGDSRDVLRAPRAAPRRCSGSLRRRDASR